MATKVVRGEINMTPSDSHFPLIDPRCHGNEMWDKMSYNSTYVRDISEIRASNKGF